MNARLWIGVLAASAVASLAQAQDLQPVAEPSQQPAAAEPAAAPVAEPPSAAPSEAPAAITTMPEAEAVPPPPAADMPSDAEVDALIAETGDTAEIGEDMPSLQLYGFADFSYGGILRDDDGSSKAVTGDSLSFAVGNINLYAAANLTHGFRSLFEIRFLYLPNGDLSTTGGNIEIVHTAARDYTDSYRVLRWGAIEIERAWIEYQAHSLLVIRAGQWLTPYGIWNVDHGSPAIIPVLRPYIIGEELFPERQTGLELYGSLLIGDLTAGYHLSLSNGRGSVTEYRDADNNKAVGGRLFLSTNALGTLTVGGSIYAGQATDGGARISLEDPSRPGLVPTVESQYDELAYAADLLWQWEGLHVQGEIIANETAFADDHRPLPRFSPVPGRGPDLRRWGTYGLIGYRLPWLGIMPYVTAEYFDSGNSVAVLSSNIVNDQQGYSAGLNVRPIPTVVFKVAFTHVRLYAAGAKLNTIQSLFSQIAWSY